MLLTDYQKGYILYSRNTSKGISRRKQTAHLVSADARSGMNPAPTPART